MTKMDAYISKEEAAQAIREYAEYRAFNSFYKGMRKALEIVNNVAAADVKPVVRGSWRKSTIQDGHDCWGRIEYTTIVRCSECGFTVDKYVTPNFCSNCGADMREEQDDR